MRVEAQTPSKADASTAKAYGSMAWTDTDVVVVKQNGSIVDRAVALPTAFQAPSDGEFTPGGHSRHGLTGPGVGVKG